MTGRRRMIVLDSWGRGFAPFRKPELWVSPSGQFDEDRAGVVANVFSVLALVRSAPLLLCTKTKANRRTA